jgi:hypothetical protein
LIYLRWLFWILLIVGIVALISVSIFVQETLRSIVGNGSGYYNPTPFQWLARRRGKLDEELIEEIRKKRNPPKLNFFSPFLYLLEPDVFILLFFSGLHYFLFYCYLTSITNQFIIHYGLSETQIGFCFLASGFGTIVGSILEGRLLDRDYRIVSEQIKENNSENNLNEGLTTAEFPIFRARFRSLWIPLSITQLIALVYGWCFVVNAPLPVMLVLQFFGKILYVPHISPFTNLSS